MEGDGIGKIGVYTIHSLTCPQSSFAPEPLTGKKTINWFNSVGLPQIAIYPLSQKEDEKLDIDCPGWYS